MNFPAFPPPRLGRRAALAAAAAALLALFAASRRGPGPILERFPIGLFGVDTEAEVDAAAAAGFDSAVLGGGRAELPALLGRASRRGLGVLAWSSGMPKDGLPPFRSRALHAWYVYDEPDVIGLSSAALAGLLAELKAWDPSRPAVFVVGQGNAARVYGGLGDALMLDWYPVPHLPLESLAEQIGEAYWFTGGKPLWVVIQAFDWRDYPQRDPKKPRIGRFPDHSEMRLMSYLAVVHGARGLFYYTMRRGRGSLVDAPEEWQAVARVAREMRAMAKIWSRGRRIPLPADIPLDGLEAAAWRRFGRDYLVLVNPATGTDRRVPESLLDGSWRVLFEPRGDPKRLLREEGGVHYLRQRSAIVLESRFRLK